MPGAQRRQPSENRDGAPGGRLRSIQLWIPDTRSPDFAAEARRESLLAAQSPHAEEDQAFVDSISEEFPG